eukprot:3660813-Pleurochrysis_carterae.AAC.1
MAVRNKKNGSSAHSRINGKKYRMLHYIEKNVAHKLCGGHRRGRWRHQLRYERGGLRHDHRRLGRVYGVARGRPGDEGDVHSPHAPATRDVPDGLGTAG